MYTLHIPTEILTKVSLSTLSPLSSDYELGSFIDEFTDEDDKSLYCYYGDD